MVECRSKERTMLQLEIYEHLSGNHSVYHDQQCDHLKAEKLNSL